MTDEQIAAALAARYHAANAAARAARAADLNALLGSVKSFAEKHGKDGMSLLAAEIETLMPRRSRVVLDEAKKAEVMKLLEEGKRTVPSIAQEYGISTATVNAWKAQAGLTRKQIRTA